MPDKPLKEHPECRETVESSYTFKQDLLDAGGITNLLQVIADFVNLNYTPKK